MAYLQNAIGTHDFSWLREQIVMPQEDLRVVRRPGVNGVQITKLGLSGREFAVLSGVDLADYGSGFDLYKEYCELTSADPVNLIAGGESMQSNGFKVKVLDVRKVEHYKSLVQVGNLLNSPSQAFLSCAWTLIGIPI